MRSNSLERSVPQLRAATGRRRLATTAELAVADLPPILEGLPGPDKKYSPQEDINRELAKLIDLHAYGAAFEAAIKRVAKNEVLELSAITTMDQFYFYLDRLVKWIPQIRHWEMQGDTVHERTVYLRIVQFYFYFNQRELQGLQSPIAPAGPRPRLTPLSEWMRKFAVQWGSFLDTPASAEKLESFKYAPEYNWQDYQKPPEEYATFNEFFARQFKDIDTQRPVANAADPRVVVFPAESTFVGQWTVSSGDPDGPVPAPPSIVVKHIEWPIQELLADSAFADDFAGGRFCHSFLNTYDYHRLHTPVAGQVVEARFIPGQVYLQVELKKSDKGSVLPNGDLANAVIPRRYLDADDDTGYQFVQCRGLLVIDTKLFGKVAVLPMGMAQVSSVVFVNPTTGAPVTLTDEERKTLTYDEQVAKINDKLAKEVVGHDVKKGQMFSFFQFGGSDCVMVFERKANINITAQVGVHYPIRSQYAVANYNAE